MTLGTKLRQFTTKVCQKSGRIASLADKVGRLPLGIGEEARNIARYATMAQAVAKDVGDIGTKTGTFQRGGITTGMIEGLTKGTAIGGSERHSFLPALGRGYAHLATHQIGSGAKLLSQAHNQLRSRDVVSEGGRLTRSAGHHLRRFQR